MPPSMMGKPKFFFPPPVSKIADPLIAIKDVAFGYTAEATLFTKLSLKINNGDKCVTIVSARRHRSARL